MHIGIIEAMFLVGFSYFLVTYLCRDRIVRRLWENDLLTEQAVRPRLYGITYHAGVAVVNGIAAVVAFAINNSTMAICLLGGCSLFGFFLLNLLGSSISYDEEKLTLREGRRIGEIPTTAIRRMQWGETANVIGPSLVIYLWSGEKIVLPHMNYIGLRKMANFFYLKFFDDSEEPGECG